MSDAFLSAARSTIRRTIASAPSSVVFWSSLAFARGVRRLGRPRMSSGFWSVIGSIQSMFADMALDGWRDEVADGASGRHSGPDVGRGVAQHRRVDEHETLHASRKMRLQPLARQVSVAQSRHDRYLGEIDHALGLVPL